MRERKIRSKNSRIVLIKLSTRDLPLRICHELARKLLEAYSELYRFTE